MASKIISITDARKNFLKIVEEVQKPDTYYFFTKNGEKKAVMLSAEEFDSMLETMEILSDPDAMKRIEQSKKEIERGDYLTIEEVEAMFKKDKKGV